jgi:cyclopropane-fatty-acyl-phospholipid synthase
MATQADIEAHYDVDNEFFGLFLDEKYRAYTCAVWEKANDLEQAQTDKYDRICNYANVQNGHHVMDVGCGWGGLMNLIADKYSNTHVHGLTISTEQFNYVNNIKKPNVSASLSSWRDYATPSRKFDSIVTVCAFEHFASVEDQAAAQQRDIYKDFFDWCLSISTDDAQIALQTIVVTRPPNNLTELRDTRYILEKVFPGSALSSISDIQAAIVDKYEISAANRIGHDYVRTVTEWDKKLELNKEIIKERYGQGLFEHYRTYFDAARRCLETGYADLYQVSLKRATPIRVLSR